MGDTGDMSMLRYSLPMMYLPYARADNIFTYIYVFSVKVQLKRKGNNYDYDDDGMTDRW